MKKLLVLLVGAILLSGCRGTETFVRGEGAFGSSVAFAKLRNDQKTEPRADGTPAPGTPMNGIYTSIKAGIRKEVFTDTKLGIAIGPAIFVPTKGPSEEYFSAEAIPHITYVGWPIHPYFEVLAGVGFSDRKRWEGEGTQYLFSIGSGIGVSIPLNKRWEIDVGYRYYHVSNGTKVFGSPDPNVGYNTDLFMLGAQYNF